MINTLLRAFTIVKRNQIRIAEITPGIIEFKVKQRTGQWTQVWLELKRGSLTWNCNAESKGFGCVFNTGSKERPYCSHTKAAYLWLLNRGIECKEGITAEKVRKELFSSQEKE